MFQLEVQQVDALTVFLIRKFIDRFQDLRLGYFFRILVHQQRGNRRVNRGVNLYSEEFDVAFEVIESMSSHTLLLEQTPLASVEYVSTSIKSFYEDFIEPTIIELSG